MKHVYLPPNTTTTQVTKPVMTNELIKVTNVGSCGTVIAMHEEVSAIGNTSHWVHVTFGGWQREEGAEGAERE